MEEVNALPGSPLQLPHPCWWTGRKFCNSWSPKPTRVAAMNGCHHDAGHQGQQYTMSLLNDQFWWPNMATQMQRAISSCWAMHPTWGHSCQSTNATPSLPHLWSCCMLTLPALRQWWSWINPQMWWTFWSFVTILWNHVMAYVTPNQMVKTVAKFCGKATSQSSEH